LGRERRSRDDYVASYDLFCEYMSIRLSGVLLSTSWSGYLMKDEMRIGTLSRR